MDLNDTLAVLEMVYKLKEDMNLEKATEKKDHIKKD